MACSVVIMGASGRMGATLVSLAQSEGLQVAGVVERPERVDAIQGLGVPYGSDVGTVLAQCKGAVIIDFTAPEATINTAKVAAKYGNPMVIGTTGFTDAEKEILQNMAQSQPIFWAPNMSIGIHAMVSVLPRLVQMLGPGFDIDVLEIHHNRKKDAPSGTALRLGECLAQARDVALSDVANYHREGIIGERPAGEIGLQTLRGGDVVGVHTVYFMGAGERIEMTHQAHSRDNFAQGALRAAKWLSTQAAGRLYSMEDLFL